MMIGTRADELENNIEMDLDALTVLGSLTTGYTYVNWVGSLVNGFEKEFVSVGKTFSFFCDCVSLSNQFWFVFRWPGD